MKKTIYVVVGSDGEGHDYVKRVFSKEEDAKRYVNDEIIMFCKSFRSAIVSFGEDPDIDIYVTINGTDSKRTIDILEFDLY